MLMEAISYSYGYSLEGLAYPVQDKYKYIRDVQYEMKLEDYKKNSEYLDNNQFYEKHCRKNIGHSYIN